MGEITIAGYGDNFRELFSRSPGKLVVCGAIPVLCRFLPYLPAPDFFWNIQGDKNLQDLAIPTIDFEGLKDIKESVYVLVCFNDAVLLQDICNVLRHTDMTARVFNFYDNCAFDFFRESYNYEFEKAKAMSPLKVCIVNYDTTGWILTKFAQRMNENLNEMGILSEIRTTVDPTADINHHISFHSYEPLADFNDTLMITHIDCQHKVELLRHQLRTAKMGICMSRETMNMLTDLGIPRNKLCYVNPAHDGNMRPKKYVVGITHKCHEEYDLRKRISSLLDILEGINPDFFKFKIMGAGWQNVVSVMEEWGIEVEYYPEFDYDLYHELMPTLDYYMFFGFDEGSMGYLDALAAGVKTIVTPQGFHLDVPNGIDFACRTVDQFANVLYDLQYEREKRIASVADWTWENYTKKHVEIWKYITGKSPLQEIYANQLRYEDGIFSCLISNNAVR